MIDQSARKPARKSRSERPSKRPPKPLDSARLEELALAYVARFATTRLKLEAYLMRKLRERGWDEDGAADGGEDADEIGKVRVADIAERMVAAGYVDDAAYARAKSGSLLRRGYGAARVSQALGMAGVSEDLREDVRPGGDAQRRAALTMARKRRFGPFGAAVPDRARREKQIAAMLRAGHRLDNARVLVDAPTVEAAEDWAAQASEDSCED